MRVTHSRIWKGGLEPLNATALEGWLLFIKREEGVLSRQVI